MADVLRYPLVLCHPEQCAGGYKLFMKPLHQRAAATHRCRVCPGHESMMILVGAGRGIGFGLETQAATFNYPDIIIRPVTDKLVTARTFIVTNKVRNCLELQRFIVRAKRIGGTAEPGGGDTAPLEPEVGTGEEPVKGSDQLQHVTSAS